MMAEGMKPGGAEEDIGDGMQCSDHPYRNNPGGICAFCLQEKLGKLLTSSSSKFSSSAFFPAPVAPSSSSSSPSFRSDFGGAGAGGSSLSLSLSARRPNSSSAVANSGGGKDCHYHQYSSRRARIPFLSAQKKKKKKESESAVLRRSKSTATPRRGGGHFLDDGFDGDDNYVSRKRSGGFWSFLYPSKYYAAGRRPNKTVRECSADALTCPATAGPVISTAASVRKTPRERGSTGSFSSKKGAAESADEADSPTNASSSSSFGRKVSRSRSVGCGSRSFSGDFFERISTGFGDCTLRRVESQREGKPKVNGAPRGGGAHEHHNCIKERVKCGGIFGGFTLTSSSSSSSSSSYWVSASTEDTAGKSMTPGPLAHGRSKSWGWAFASPMRAFGKPTSKDGKRDVIREASDKNTGPNLAAIPSLLAVRS